jgi:uncharacterized protein (TIGR02118 family)
MPEARIRSPASESEALAYGSPPPFAAICGFTCETIEDFMAAFNPVAGDLQGDIPNYTDVTPIIQVSDIRIG